MQSQRNGISDAEKEQIALPVDPSNGLAVRLDDKSDFEAISRCGSRQYGEALYCGSFAHTPLHTCTHTRASIRCATQRRDV